MIAFAEKILLESVQKPQILRRGTNMDVSSLAAAAVTGHPPQDLGEHAAVRMR